MDMTKGSIRRNLILFIIPLAVGNVLQQLYNITDVFILGRYVGSDALAAVGAVTIMTFVFNAIIFGLKAGISIVCSTHFGEKNYSKVKTTISTGIILLVILGLLSTLIGICGCDAILAMLHTPKELLGEAAVYLRIYSIGIFFVFMFNFCYAVFQSLGNSRIPFIILVISTAVNIVGDITLVIYFNMGVAGTAIATVLAQAISSIVAALFLVREFKAVDTNKEKYKLFDVEVLKNVFSVGFPSIVQQAVVSVGILIVQSYINRCGADTISGVTIASKIEGIVSMPIVTIGEAVSVFTAQNVGAKKEYRIREGVTTALKIDYILVTILLVVLIFTGKPITRLFLGEEVSEEILTASFEYLMSLGIGLYFMSINHSVGGMLRGIQKMIPFLTSFVINIFVRIISAYILFHAFWRIGVFIANPVSFMAGSIVALYFYKKLYYDKYIRRNRYEEGSYYKCNEA